MNNLAGNSAHASVEHELHGLLTSLVDSDAITEAVFRKQHQVLMEMVQKKTPEGFFQTLMGRLRLGQASALTQNYYQNWKPSPSSADAL